jgi:hypothetical protein
VTHAVDPARPDLYLADTGWFVYGIVAADAAFPEDLTGLDGEPVRTLAHGRVAAVITRVALERPPGRGADLLAYNSVLDALAQGGGQVVPVRFGSVLADDADVVEGLLAPDEGYFADLLLELEGRRQYVFQADFDEEVVLREIVADDPEIAELRAMTRDLPEEASYGQRVRLGELVAAAVEARRGEDADRLLDDVLPVTDAHVLRPVSGLQRVVDAAFLVADERRGDFENRLEVLAEELHGRMQLRLMGPTAPYDFVGST